MTQLPRIGEQICHADDLTTWRVYGKVDDHSGRGEPTVFLIESEFADGEITAEEFWQHWTPATQRNT